MLQTVPFDPIHMTFLEPHPEFAAAASREDPEMLAHSKEAWTFLDGQSNVIAIVGIMETHERCAYLWTFMSKRAGPQMLRITRWMTRWLPTLGMVRIEATVAKDFRAAHRWMRLLKFYRETRRPMKRWDGFSDFHLYSRIAR